MSRKLNGISRDVFNNEKLEDCLKAFKDIVACIEDIIKEPDDGSGRSMSSICLDHKINYINLRRLTSLVLFSNIYADKVLSTADIIIEEDPYETLYRRVFEIKDNEVVEFPVDLHESIDHTIGQLTQREQGVIRMRFGLGEEEYPMTLDEVGSVFKVSRDRIHQIEAKAMRKLKFHSKAKVIRDGLIKSNEDKKIAELDLMNKTMASEQLLKEYENNISKLIEAGESVIPIIETEAPKIKVSELEFTVRTFNCLMRSGRNTMWDLLITSNPNFMKIRNFGKSSFEEVEFKINKYLAKYGLNRRNFMEIEGIDIDGESR